MSKARNAGGIAFWICPAQPSAEFVRVNDGDLARATLCGDRACRRREMKVRLRFCPVQRNGAKSRRDCVFARSSAKPSAEIVRVEGARSGSLHSHCLRALAV